MMLKSGILVVDDDPIMREMLCEILQGGEHDIFVAENGQSALELCRSQSAIGLVVTDLQMPVMGGVELIKQLRREKFETPIIILTANNEVSTAVEAIRAGANDYLLKDRNIGDTLPLSVSDVLEKRRIIAQNRRLMADLSRMNQELDEIVAKLTEIGTALSSEKDLNRLLDLIVTHARAITKADAGTLYLVKNNLLHFQIVQNASMDFRSLPDSFPAMEMKESNIAGFVALSGRAVNIPDVYACDLFDFTGPKKFDAVTGYRSRSMLVVPMRNHENEINGVLQLLNAKDPDTGEVVTFSGEAEKLAQSVASQAAVAITGTHLIRDLEELFYAFTQVMASAIDEKSPVTGGHIRRMSNLTMEMAHVINEQQDGAFKEHFFNEERLSVLRIASWMHDIGKVTTPVEIIEKGKKLEAIFDRIQFVDLRLQLAKKSAEVEFLKKRAALSAAPGDAQALSVLEEAFRNQIAELEDIRIFLTQCNHPDEFIEDAKVERLRNIRKMTYSGENGETHPFLTDDELENLSIRKGSITERERKKMQDHALVTINMLQQIPFTKRLKDIPLFAGAHHEHINGKGYPSGLKGDDIPFEGKLMAVTDIAEALTAKDRPYKKAMPLENVYRILRLMAKDGQLDNDLVELFIGARVYERYAEKYEKS